jgi:AraC family transcriptional regulator
MVAVLRHKQGLPDNAIATLHRGLFGKVQIVRCSGSHVPPASVQVAPRLHFSLPLSGSFVCHAQHADVLADPATLLCTQAGESFRISHPHGGDDSLVFFPSTHLLDHLSERAANEGLARPRRTLIAPARAQILAHMLCADPETRGDALAADECLLQFFEMITLGEIEVRASSDDPLVRKTLEYVHHTAEPLLTLKNIAAAMGVRASHLTHSFAQRTGQPLYRYVMTLKLSRALHRVATSDVDLTDLALDLGFSSHSHFSAVFKSRYAMSPSEARTRFGGRKRSRDASKPASESRRLDMKWRPLCAARGGLPTAKR